MANLRLSLSKADNKEGQCHIYLTAMLVDLTLGVVIIWVLVRFTDIMFAKAKLNSMVSGNYFELRKVNGKREYFISYKHWALQCALWTLFAIVTKAICVFVQFHLPGYHHLASLILTM